MALNSIWLQRREKIASSQYKKCRKKRESCWKKALRTTYIRLIHKKEAAIREKKKIGRRDDKTKKDKLRKAKKVSITSKDGGLRIEKIIIGERTSIKGEIEDEKKREIVDSEVEVREIKNNPLEEERNVETERNVKTEGNLREGIEKKNKSITIEAIGKD